MSRPGPASRLHFFPVAIAVYPAVFLAARNPAEFSLLELAGVSLALIAVGIAAYGLVHLALRRRAQSLATACVASVVLVWMLLSLRFTDTLAAIPVLAPLIRMRYAIPLTTVVAAMIIRLILQTRADLAGPARVLAICVYAALCWSVVTIGWHAASVHRRLENDVVVQSLMTPLGAQSATQTWRGGSHNRDLYLLILDQYANARVLQQTFGFSNARFEDSLRKLGFSIPPATRSNYTTTAPSLASLLNLEHVSAIDSAFGWLRTPAYHYLIENNRVVDFFQRRGYRFDFFPSQLFVGTRHNRHADAEHVADAGHPFKAAFTRSLIAYAVWYGSVPGRVAEGFGLRVRTRLPEVATFDGLKHLGEKPGPKIVIAHIMITHEPFYLDPECRESRNFDGRAWSDKKTMYPQQVDCTNALVLDFVSSILRDSPVTPIIVLQADHGTGTTLDSGPHAIGRYSLTEQTAERFGAFGAYLLPDGGGQALDSVTTPVNVFRTIFNYYFGFRLPLRPDSSIW